PQGVGQIDRCDKPAYRIFAALSYLTRPIPVQFFNRHRQHCRVLGAAGINQ
ncbi:MAG: hypothetical protein ACI9RZ_000681, partial [Sphingobacteriales bacterium]